MKCASKSLALSPYFCMCGFNIQDNFVICLIALVSGRVPNVPVVSKISGHLFEKELIEKHILDHGKCPKLGVLLTMDDIIAMPIQEPNPKSAPFLCNGDKTGEQSACPQFPDGIAKQITSTRINLSQYRKRYRKISTSLATVDALRKCIFDKGYTLHETIGGLSLDIDNSKEIIATGGADTNAVVFDLLSRKTVSTLCGHSEKVTSVKFVNEGELIVTGSSDKTVRVWRRSEKGSYECKDTLAHHTAEVRAVTIHPSQKYLVTASLDCSWQFYDLSSESRVSRVACSTGSEGFSNAVFHPDGHIFGTCALGQGLVRFWDVAKQDDILKIDAHTAGGPVTSIAFSENGYTLATAAASDDVKLWDLRFLRTMKTFPSGQTNSVDFDHSGKYLATGGEHISIYEIDAAWDPITTFSDLPAKGDVSCVKFGKDAKYVAAAAGTSDSKLLLFGL